LQIVLATDIFGTGITNPKIVADKMAKKTGFTGERYVLWRESNCSSDSFSVYVPEIFPGGPIDPNDFQLPSKASEGMPDEKRMGSNMDNFGKWMGKDNGPDKTYPRFKAVVDEAAKKGPVGAVGYCYGGKLVVLASKEGAVKGVAIYHPAMLEPPEAEEIKTPVLINAAELDPSEYCQSFQVYEF
jgi:carboxymethylenebutenolidase